MRQIERRLRAYTKRQINMVSICHDNKQMRCDRACVSDIDSDTVSALDDTKLLNTESTYCTEWENV